MTQPPYPPGPQQPGNQPPYQGGPQQPYRPQQPPYQPPQPPHQGGPQQPYQPGPPPYQAGFSAPAAPKKSNKGCLIAAAIVGAVLVVIVVVIIAVVAAVSKGVSNVTTADHTITYKVETTGKAQVVYGTTTGTSQATITAPWTTDKKVNGIDVTTLIATLDYDVPDNATISCEILVDGKSQSKNAATGKSGSVSCSATTVR